MIKILLGLIIISAALFRVVGLDQYPLGVTADEIQQGFTGYSLLNTGKDEWGDLLPLNPRGFGDYKPPLYSYLTIPSIAIFGLNIISIRLPSALFGAATILVVYLLVKELTKRRAIALFAALLLSISLWHVHISRLGFESNVGSFLFLAGVWAFLKGLNRPVMFVLSALMFGLALQSYHPFKIITPLYLMGLVIIYRSRIKELPFSRFALPGLIFAIFLSLTAYGFLFSGAGRRAADAAVYSSENVTQLRDMQIADPLPQPWGRVINNRWQYIGSQFIQNYAGYFSTTFWLSPHRSDSTVFNLPGQWLISFWELALILLALFLIIRHRPEWSRPVILLGLIAPVPAALTRDYMHAQRVEILLFLAPILAAVGMVFLIDNFSKSHLKRLVFLGLTVIITWTVVSRVDHYLFHTFNRPLGGMKYGYGETVKIVEEIKGKYQQVIFTKRNSEPHIFVAFYSQMSPVLFQNNSLLWRYFETSGFKFLDMIDYQLDKYSFQNIDWGEDSKRKNTLIVADPQDLPKEVTPLKKIYDPWGKEVFVIVDTNFIEKN